MSWGTNMSAQKRAWFLLLQLALLGFIRRRRLTRSRFTNSVNGLYQQVGPHGMMARVTSPRWL